MQATNPTDVWSPADALRPVPLDPTGSPGGSNVAIFTPTMLAAGMYDVVLGGVAIFYTPLLDLRGWTNHTFYYSIHTKTGVVAQTMDIDFAAVSPEIIFSTAQRTMGNDNFASVNLAAATLDTFVKKTVPGTLTTLPVYPLCYGYWRIVIGNGGIGSFTDFKLWFSGFAWSSGFRG